jgi:RNA polymerase sigma factor (sigma-70 family)
MDAGENLCARYFREIYRFFEYKIPGEADDLAQQTFLACVKSRDQFRGLSSFRTFLFGIAKNVFYTRLRQKVAHKHVDLEVSSLDDIVASTGNKADREHELAAVLAALRQLPVAQQVLLEFRYWHDSMQRRSRSCTTPRRERFASSCCAPGAPSSPGSRRSAIRCRQAIRCRPPSETPISSTTPTSKREPAHVHCSRPRVAPDGGAIGVTTRFGENRTAACNDCASPRLALQTSGDCHVSSSEIESIGAGRRAPPRC